MQCDRDLAIGATAEPRGEAGARVPEVAIDQRLQDLGASFRVQARTRLTSNTAVRRLVARDLERAPSVRTQQGDGSRIRLRRAPEHVFLPQEPEREHDRRAGRAEAGEANRHARLVEEAFDLVSRPWSGRVHEATPSRKENPR